MSSFTPSDVSSPDRPPSNRAADPDRRRALDRYDVLDTPPEDTFDHISDLAAGLFDAPIGLITFVDAGRQWHKACVGFDVPELDLDASFCVHVLGDARRLVVEDATDDERFADNPLVTGDRHIRFYAGSPITTPDGHVLGTVCVLDTEPRTPSEQKLQRLDHLAQMAVDRLEERRRHKIEEVAEPSLDATGTRLNELLAALDDVVWEARIHPSGPTDADPVRSEILYTNSSEERVYGRPTGAFVQDPMLWRSAAHPEDKDDLPTIETLLAEGQWSGEYRLLRPNGTARWVETSIHAVGRSGRPTETGDTSGPKDLERPFKLAGITRDIHRRKEAEASVRAKRKMLDDEKERLQLALKAAGAKVFDWHIPEDDRVWDEGVQQMFGLDGPPRSTGELLEQIHPDDRGLLQEVMGSVLGNPDKRTCQVEYRVPRPDGGNRHIRARGLITRDDDGEAIRMTGFYQDRTETMERRQELRRNERRFEAVFQDPDLFGGLLDLEGTLYAVNDTALSYVDAGRDDVVGRPFWETPWWNHDSALQADLREWIDRATNGEYVSFESDHITGDGLTFTVRGSIRPVTDKDGTVTSLIVSARDVTQRVNQRRELETLHEAIEDAADGIAVLIDGEYMYVDQAHVDLYGFDDKEQLLGASWRKLYRENEVRRFEETVFPILREEGHWQGYVTGSRPDGSTFPAELSLTMTGRDRLVCTVRDLTERRKQERRRDLLLTASGTGIAEWTPHTGEVYWDETLRNVFGRAPESFEQFGEIVHPSDRARVREYLHKVVDDNTSWTGEFRVEDGQGRTRWLSTLVIPVREETGTTRVLATGRDVTERKEQEKQLRMLSTAVEQATEAVLIATGDRSGDSKLEIEYVNEAYEEMTGWAEEEIIGEMPPGLQDAETDREIPNSLRAALEAGDAWQGETINHKKNGEPYWVQWNVSPVIGADGEIEHWVFIQRDVTERREREQALAQSREHYQTLLEAAPDPVFVAEANTGDIIEVNAAVEEILGRPREEIVGRPHTDLYPEADVEAWTESFEQSVGKSVIVSELPDGSQPTLRTADGTTVPVEVTSDTVELPDGPVMYGVFRDVSEQKAHQRALRRTNQRFEQFAEAVPNAFFIVSADYDEILHVNSAVETLYGVDAGALKDDPSAWTRHVHPADLPALQAAMRAQGGDEADWPQHQEFRVQHPTRGQRWLSVSLHALEGVETGAPKRIAGIATDITERKTRERRLQALHHTTSNLIAPDTEAEAAKTITDTLGETLGLEEAAVYLRDGDVLVRASTPGGGRVGPMPRIEKGHTPLWTAVNTDESQTYADPRLIDDEVDRSGLEACAYVPLGQHGALAVGTADQGRLDEAEIQFVETMAQSLRKALDSIERERGLVVSERRYRTLAENIPNGAVLLFDGNCRYTLAAGELIGAFGLEESDILGLQAGTVLNIGPDGAERLVERYWAALEGERTDQRVEIGDRFLRIHIVPIQGRSESQGLLLAQDVTEEVRRERELIEAKETAQAANEMRSALLANMSHEIRTPLTSIIGFAGTIGKEVDPESNAAYFAELIESGGQRLMNTLDSVLNLSKLEREDHTLSIEPVDLSVEVESIVGELHPAAEEKSIALSAEADSVTAQADAGAVQIVVRNLVKNAIKYTEAGGEVEVRTRVAGDTAVLEVEDSGIGIDEEALPHIFEQFRQESEGLKREYDGVGLGLATVEQAVEQMDGRIEVDTEKGEGTTFFVRLPRAWEDTDPCKSP